MSCDQLRQKGSVITKGVFFLVHVAAVDPITKKPLCANGFFSNIHSRNNVSPLMIILAKETKDSYDEFKSFAMTSDNQYTPLSFLSVLVVFLSWYKHWIKSWWHRKIMRTINPVLSPCEISRDTSLWCYWSTWNDRIFCMEHIVYTTQAKRKAHYFWLLQNTL